MKNINETIINSIESMVNPKAGTKEEAKESLHKLVSEVVNNLSPEELSKLCRGRPEQETSTAYTGSGNSVTYSVNNGGKKSTTKAASKPFEEMMPVSKLFITLAKIEKLVSEKLPDLVYGDYLKHKSFLNTIILVRYPLVLENVPESTTPLKLLHELVMGDICPENGEILPLLSILHSITSKSLGHVKP